MAPSPFWIRVCRDLFKTKTLFAYIFEKIKLFQPNKYDLYSMNHGAKTDSIHSKWA